MECKILNEISSNADFHVCIILQTDQIHEPCILFRRRIIFGDKKPLRVHLNFWHISYRTFSPLWPHFSQIENNFRKIVAGVYMYIYVCTILADESPSRMEWYRPNTPRNSNQGHCDCPNQIKWVWIIARVGYRMSLGTLCTPTPFRLFTNPPYPSTITLNHTGSTV